MEIILIFSIVCIISILSTCFVFMIKKKKKNYNKFLNIVGNFGFIKTIIDDSSGIVEILNADNTYSNFSCKTYNSTIQKNKRVLITEYDIDNEIFVVDNYPEIKNMNEINVDIDFSLFWKVTSIYLPDSSTGVVILCLITFQSKMYEQTIKSRFDAQKRSFIDEIPNTILPNELENLKQQLIDVLYSK